MGNRHHIQPSGRSQPGGVGKLFDAWLDGAFLIRDYGAGPVEESVSGLALALPPAGEGETQTAAQIEVLFGAPEGGAEDSRLFTLTRRGVWIQATGWSTVRAFVRAVRDDTTVVTYTWTDITPSTVTPLILVQRLTAAQGDTPVPRGAAHIAADTTDPGWEWRTNQDGTGDIVQAVSLTGGGASISTNAVLGARFVPSIATNDVTWSLVPP